MTTEEFRHIALSFPETTEAPHFDRTAFKVTGKRIFTTLHHPTETANIKLSKKEQTVFCSLDEKIVYAVPNKWGDQGWTTFELKNASRELILEALDSAYRDVLTK